MTEDEISEMVKTQYSPPGGSVVKNDSINEQTKQEPREENTKNQILKALDEDFATSVNMVYINSLKKEFGFREITALEQKKFSRLLIDNENRIDMIYNTQCAMIEKTALDPSFKIEDITEFDRLKLMVSLYQQNMFADEMKFTCEECGTENKYKIDFTGLIKKLDSVDISPVEHEYENSKFKFKFKVEYPLVKRMMKFYDSYFKMNGALPKNKASSFMENAAFDQINMYISEMEYTVKSTNVVRKFVMSDFSIREIIDMFNKFPQDVMYSENGLISFVTQNFNNKINEMFDKHTCYKCGAVHEKEGTNQIGNFM